MNDHPQKVHAIGRSNALCGEVMFLFPMNFAPHSVFGVDPKPLPRGGKDREWCETCLALWRERGAVRLDGER